MRVGSRLCVICALLAIRAGAAVFGESLLDRVRFELGLFDDRIFMFLTQSAPLVQQFTGFTIAGVAAPGGVDVGKMRLEWTLAAESGLSFDSSGLARWFVRASEQNIMNERTGVNQPAPSLTPGLLFGSPLYVPLRLRTEAELRALPWLRLQAGAEAAGVLLVFPPDVAELCSELGVTLGAHFSLGARFGLGLRARISNFGDLQDRWPGFGVTMYVALQAASLQRTQ